MSIKIEKNSEDTTKTKNGKNIKKKNKRGQNEGSIRQRKDGSWEARYTIGFNTKGKAIRKSIYGKTRKDVAEKLTKVLNSIYNGTYIEPAKITVGPWMDTWLENYKKQSVKSKTYESYVFITEYYIKPSIGTIPLKDLRPDHIQTMLNEIKARIPERTLNKIKKLEYELDEHSKDSKKSRKKEILDKESIEEQITELSKERISDRTIEYIKIVLSGALQQAVENTLLVRNVCDAVKLPKNADKKKIRVFTREEQEKFINALNGERLKAAFLMLLYTGIRVGELLALKWSNLDLEKGFLYVDKTLSRVKDFDSEENKTKLIYGTPKTDSGTREIPLLKSIVKILKIHKAEQAQEKLLAGTMYNNKSDLVFCTNLGKEIDPPNLAKVFYRIVKKAGIAHANLHCLRHTFATRGLESGIELKVMQVLLGHSSIVITADTYSHVLPNKKKEAMEKLNNIFDI
ncbi:MAG TPA: site-specific integrase [Bacillota bacterium]|nr:site-specific integrase [Bacillota bacterium]